MIWYPQCVLNKVWKREKLIPGGSPWKWVSAPQMWRGRTGTRSFMRLEIPPQPQPCVHPAVRTRLWCSGRVPEPCPSCLQCCLKAPVSFHPHWGQPDPQLLRASWVLGCRRAMVLTIGVCKAIFQRMLLHYFHQHQVAFLPSSLGFGPQCCPSMPCHPPGNRVFVKPA